MKKQHAVILCAHLHLELSYLHQEMDSIKTSSDKLQRKYLYEKPRENIEIAKHNLIIVNRSVQLMKRLSHLTKHKTTLLTLIKCLPIEANELTQVSQSFREIILSTNVEIITLRRNFLNYLENQEKYEMCSNLQDLAFYAIAA